MSNRSTAQIRQRIGRERSQFNRHAHCRCVLSLGDEEGRSEGRLFSRNTLGPPASVGPSSPLVRKRKKRDLMEVMEEEAQELLSYFNHRNVDALLRVTRNTLEMLRKRIHTSSHMHFSGGSCVMHEKLFKCF